MYTKSAVDIQKLYDRKERLILERIEKMTQRVKIGVSLANLALAATRTVHLDTEAAQMIWDSVDVQWQTLIAAMQAENAATEAADEAIQAWSDAYNMAPDDIKASSWSAITTDAYANRTPIVAIVPQNGVPHAAN